MGLTTWMETTNRRIAASPVGWWFQLDGSGHPKERKGSYFFTEMRAGLATFFAMAYIIAVNASIVSDSGGTCVCNETPTPGSLACENNTEYLLCVAEVKKDLVTATSAISALGTFMMGFWANLYVNPEIPGIGGLSLARIGGNRITNNPVPGPLALRPAWV